MTKVHCNGCDEVIQKFHSRLRLYAGIWKDNEGDDEDDQIDVCDDCVRKNPLLRRLVDQMQAKPKAETPAAVTRARRP
jgi:hypothetical protein